MSGNDQHADQTVKGHCAAMAALIIALDETGVLPKNRYSDVLRRLWLEMPEDEALGEAGVVVERMLDLLSAPASPARAAEDAKQGRKDWGFAGRLVNDAA